MIHYACIRSAFSFSYQCKDILIKDAYIAGKVGYYKMKKRESNRNYKEIHYIIQKSKDINNTGLRINGTTNGLLN